MNRCQFCGAPSTIHLTDIQENLVRKMHLCERCGREHELVPDSPAPQLNLPALLQLLLSQSGQDSPAAADPSSLTCPDCGLKYAQFRTAGRFGCPTDYETFAEPLRPLLERIHRSLDHAGKAPKRHKLRAERAELHERLRAAVAAEQYETAAGIRDLLRQKDMANG